MSLNVKERTSFEWFFGPPASNFPQAMTSSALQDLSIAFSKLIELHMASMGSIPPTVHGQWTETVKEAASVAAKLESDFSMLDAFSLIKALLRIQADLDALKEYSRDQFNIVWPQYRRVLASLILYAKESRDASFKRSVLDLVERSEIVS